MDNSFFPRPSNLVKHYFNDDNVLIIQISKGTHKPYYLREKGPKPSGVYIRVGRSKRQASEEEKNIINMQIEENKMLISSNIPEIGNVEEHLTIKNEKNNNIKISFSSKYMMEAIKSLESEEIEILFNGEIKPIILKNPNADDLIQLIVPIRTY